ncbi:MAG: hypothetical protein HYV27_03055 [Candidatus Hydrogenedentes bacterium]|nr:hypothetical protein [Candidatus Hydrogenedentota bacterium]
MTRSTQRILCLLTLLWTSSAPAAEAPAASCLERTATALQSMQPRLEHIAQAADAAAKGMHPGSRYWIGGHPALISEFTGRAGGIMLAASLDPAAVKPGDVILFATANDHPVPEHTTGAWIILADKAAEKDTTLLTPHGEWGLSPTLAQAIAGWIFNGEFIAALTREGRMPVLYESIGLYGGIPRQNQYQMQGIFWHDTHSAGPVPPGQLGARFITLVAAMLRRIETEERPLLDRTGAWAAAALKNNRSCWMYSMGHLFPFEVDGTEIGKTFKSGVWNSGFTQHPTPDDTYHPGDVIIHVGYQHPPYTLLPKARAAGAKTIYIDVMQHRDYPTSDDVIWIDPMWPWSDACVPIDGYDIPALAASGVVNAALAWEIHRLTAHQNQQPPAEPGV